ncbi:unannotated protein [freshwater metagenome]|uniref:Unannotated protein n=1 Tax=freshwater metagenome TaxID=449393 RepID=A0A6J6TPA9_9ZZZZ
MTHIRLKITDSAQFDERCWQESTETNIDDEATLDDFDDKARNHTFFCFDLLDVSPSTLVLSTLLGEDQATLFVFFLKYQGLNQVADADYLGGVDLIADGEFTVWNNTFGLVSDVQQDLVAVNLDHGTADQLAILNCNHARCIRVFERLTVKIIKGDLAGDVGLRFWLTFSWLVGVGSGGGVGHVGTLRCSRGIGTL